MDLDLDRARVTGIAGPHPMRRARTVTITSNDRVIWTGTYAEFQKDNLDSLSVSEFCELERAGSILVGGGAAPLLRIACDSPIRSTEPLNLENDQ